MTAWETVALTAVTASMLALFLSLGLALFMVCGLLRRAGSDPKNGE